MRQPIAVKWFEVGLELLEQEDVHKLNRISEENPRDIVRCCGQMLKVWLERKPEATWNQLIKALRSPSIYLKALANKLERILSPNDKGNVIHSNYV